MSGAIIGLCIAASRGSSKLINVAYFLVLSNCTQHALVVGLFAVVVVVYQLA